MLPQSGLVSRPVRSANQRHRQRKYISKLQLERSRERTAQKAASDDSDSSYTPSDSSSAFDGSDSDGTHNDGNYHQGAKSSGTDDDDEDADIHSYSDCGNVFDFPFDDIEAYDGHNPTMNLLISTCNTITSVSDDDEIECADETTVNLPPVNAALGVFPPARLLAVNSSASVPPARLPSSRYMDPNNHSIARQTHLPSVEWIEEERATGQGFTRLRHSRYDAIDVVVSSNRLNKAKEKLHPDAIQHCMISPTTCICSKSACYHTEMR